jgi:hypothetical protein
MLNSIGVDIFPGHTLQADLRLDDDSRPPPCALSLASNEKADLNSEVLFLFFTTAFCCSLQLSVTFCCAVQLSVFIEHGTSPHDMHMYKNTNIRCRSSNSWTLSFRVKRHSSGMLVSKVTHFPASFDIFRCA